MAETRADLHVLSEPGTVVVPGRLCVSEGLHDGVGGEHLPLDLAHAGLLDGGSRSDPSLTLSTDRSARVLYRSEVSKDELGRDSLSGSTVCVQSSNIAMVSSRLQSGGRTDGTDLSPETTIV